MKTETRYPLTNGFPDGSSSEESACNVGDTGDTVSIPGLGRSPGGGNDNPLQYSFLPEESHGQKNLQAISPKDHRESDMTERLSTCAS